MAPPAHRKAHLCAMAAGLLLALLPADTASAYTFRILYSFCAVGNCIDGSQPLAGLVSDSAGNLYGNASQGGAHAKGVVFELVRNGSSYDYKTLYDFCSETNCVDGYLPVGDLVVDVNGNLYGTAEGGGAHSSGTLFKLSTKKGSWSLKTIHDFCSADSCSDGDSPQAGVTFVGAASGGLYDGLAPLYGTAPGGLTGGGIAFEFYFPEGKTRRKEKVIYNYCSPDCSDGGAPGALISNPTGTLYGVGQGGSANNGVVSQLRSRNGKRFTETVLYNFCTTDCKDGARPVGRLGLDANGNLYGTTQFGNPTGNGVLYELVPKTSQQTVLHSFCSALNCTDGRYPLSGTIVDAQGNVFGTTSAGGEFNYNGGGVVFEYSGSTYTVLKSFCENSCSDGTTPNDLIVDSDGNLFGTTQGGGAFGQGEVFELSP